MLFHCASRAAVKAPALRLGLRLPPHRSVSRLIALPPALIAALLPGSLAAQAQETKDLPTVTITGERPRSFRSSTVQVGTFRDQEPIDVPLTSNVVTREVLDAQGVDTAYGALRNTAGVTRSQLNGATYDNLSIRGILVENRGNYRLNGSLPIVNLIAVPLENKERVEVLKGVSSLYYGFVPPSGIVNYVTKRAGERPVNSVAFTVNDHGAAATHADVGRRFAQDGSMGLRVNAVAGKEDIGVRNFDGRRSLVSLAYDWKATSDVNVKLDLEHYRKNVSEQAAIAVLPPVNGVITLPPIPDNKLNLAGAWQRYDAQATNALLRTDIALNDTWSALLELGRANTQRDRRFSQFRDYDLSTGDGTLRITFSDDQEFQNTNGRAELFGRLQAGSVAHELSLGVTANRREQDSGNFPTANVAQNLYNPVNVPYMDRPAPNASNPSHINDKGVYVFDRVIFGPRWQAMVGVRGSDYESVTTTTRYTARRANPTVSVLFKPLERLSVYGSYLEGLEETGEAPANRANAGEVLAPAVAKQKEIGVKTELAQGLLVQTAYFDIERPYTTVDASNRFVLGGEAQYRGLELSATGEVNRQLAVIASAMLLDAEITQTTVANEQGNVPDNTPERTASLFGEYKLMSLPGLALNAGVFYVGKRPVNNANQAFVAGYTTLSLGGRYATRIGSSDVTFQANLDNATDRDYWSTAGNGLLGVGLPRTLRLGVKVDL